MQVIPSNRNYYAIRVTRYIARYNLDFVACTPHEHILPSSNAAAVEMAIPISDALLGKRKS
jgi:hypothetical protein